MLFLLACMAPEGLPGTDDATDSQARRESADTQEPSDTGETEETGEDPSDTGETDSRSCSAPTTRTDIATLAGPAFVTSADLDQDGKREILVSRFGDIMSTFNVKDGAVVVLEDQGGSWQRTEVLAQVPFPNHVETKDLDGDGDLDLLVPSGFFLCEMLGAGACGGVRWLENTPSGFIEHALVQQDERFYHHLELADLDGDGVDDLVTTGERMGGWFGEDEAVASWLRGKGGGSFEPLEELADGLGSIPRARDVDGDGDLDLTSAEHFVEGGSFAWLEQDGTRWVRHVIRDDLGPSIQLSWVEDLYGDGVPRAVGTNHVESTDPWQAGVYVLTPGTDPKAEWSAELVSEGIVSEPSSWTSVMAAPGVFDHGDLDGDGDVDLAVSGDGDPRVFWMEQTAPGEFEMHVLDAQRPQAGVHIADLDGDGCKEVVVTGFESGVVSVYGR